MGGKFVPLVVKPRLGIESRIFSRTDGIVPLPAGKLVAARVIGHQDLRGTVRVAFRLLKHGELIGVGCFVFVNAGFNVPARKIAAIGSGKCAGAEAPDGSALPVAVINVDGVAFNTWVF